MLEQPAYIDWDMLSVDSDIAIQRRILTDEPEPAHFHPSIEINYLTGCDLTYSFSGSEVRVPRGRFCIFWAAHPHSKVRLHGQGEMTNIYVSLSSFLKWSLPGEFVNSLLAGSILTATTETDEDLKLARRLAGECDKKDLKWQRLHTLEIQSRMTRLSLEGYNSLREISLAKPASALINDHSIMHIDKMMRFVAIHFTSRITVMDVAGSAGLSQSYAIALFKRYFGRTVLEHIREVRLVHAQTLLVDTNHKILKIAMDCGFGSLSSFYECFQNHIGMSPAAFRKQNGN